MRESGATKRRRGFRSLRPVGLAALAMGLAFGSVPPGPAAEAVRQEGGLAALMPAAGEAKGWRPDGDRQLFEGDDLFVYINGGADIYHEYGFHSVGVQDYAGPEGRSLSVEIFAMRDPAAAYGMFTFKAGRGGRPVPVGAEGRLESYYLNFWEGPYVVTITGFDEEAATREGILAVARALDRRIEAAGERPALAGRLPGERLDPASVQYIRGPLGLNNIHVFFTDRNIPFEEGVKGEYLNGVRLLLLRTAGPRNAAALLRSLSEGFRTGPRYRSVRALDGGLVEAVDDRGLTIMAASSGDLVLIALGAAPDFARSLFARVR